MPVSSYAHQDAADKFTLKRPIDIAGWLYPGGAVRHVQATADTTLSEDPRRYLALLYAPVGTIYFQAHRHTAGVRPEYCLVQPEVSDLLRYRLARQIFASQGIERLHVAGAAEAAVRVLAELSAHDLLNAVEAERCRVVSFGTVPWSKQQKTRVDVYTVSDVPRQGLRTYRVAELAFPARRASSKPDPKTGEIRRWWVVPQTPDLVATNVIAGLPWLRGFAAMWQRLRDADPKQRQWAMSNERKGLQTMVHESEAMADSAEARLVQACHEAWRRRLGALGERARKQGLNFGDLASKEYESVRISFARCKNAEMLRRTLTDFWARAGGQPALQEGWVDLLPLLGNRWDEARDLALLALASYKPQTKDEAKALERTAEGEEARE